MADASVIVYPPNGGPPEKHTRANGRDLVNGSGYTWMPGVHTTPAAYAPFAALRAPEGPQPSQKVLDSVGSSGSAASTAAAGANAAQAAIEQQIAQAQAQASAQAAAAPAPAVVQDFTAAPVIDASDLDDDAAEAAIEAEAEVEAAEATEADAEETPASDDAPRGRGGRRPRA